MRKLSLIIIAFTLVLFTQCKKEKITENTNPVGEDGRMVPITLELPVDNGAKTDFSDFLMNPSNPQGTIKWSSGDTVYLAVPNRIIYDEDTGEEMASKEYAQMIPLTGTLEDGATSITFSGTVDNRVLNVPPFSYTLYYFGNTGGTPVPGTNGEGQNVTLGVKLSLDGQDGSRENLGDYHFATLEGVHVHITEYDTLASGRTVAKSYAIHSTSPFFTTQVAIAYLDFKGLENKRLYTDRDTTTQITMPNMIEVNFNSRTNTYDLEYVGYNEDENNFNLQYIQLDDYVRDSSFIVMAPGVPSIQALGKGTYNFAGSGTVANHVYYSKNVATNTLSPLEWKPFNNN